MNEQFRVEGDQEGNGHSDVGTPRVALLIVNYNAGAMLLECLAHVKQQTWSALRVIVLDNDSQDGSLELAEVQFPCFEYVRLGYNSGFAVANNRGIVLADDCDWIACLNPDAFPEPEWVAALMEVGARQPEYAFLGSLMVSADNPAVLDGTGDVYHVSGAAWRQNFHTPWTSVQYAWSHVQEIFGPCAAAALYRRDALVAVGGFDERFFCYFEDVDLAFRLRLKGYRSAYVPTARVRHKGSAITGYQSDFTIYHGYRNLEWTFFKNMPGLLLLLYLPQHLLLFMVSVAVYAWRGKGRVMLKAKRDALFGLPAIWRDRTRSHVRATTLLRVMRRGVLAPYADRWRGSYRDRT